MDNYSNYKTYDNVPTPECDVCGWELMDSVDHELCNESDDCHETRYHHNAEKEAGR